MDTNHPCLGVFYALHQSRRPQRFRAALASLSAAIDEDDITPGQLDYLFCMVAKLYVDKKGATYPAFNDVMGAFEGAASEFNRRVIVPYEERRLKENGDIFEGNLIAEFEHGLTHVANPQPEEGRQPSPPGG